MPDEKTLTPPGGDSKQAQRYIDTLSELIKADKITVSQTDLSRFNSPSMEDHYRIDLQHYDAELSHNKNPETGEETFILIFNSINKFDNENPKPVILSYLRLTDEQFLKLKQAADNQLEKFRQVQEEERFTTTMAPIDQMLSQLGAGNSTIKSTPPPPPAPEKPQEKSFDNLK